MLDGWGTALRIARRDALRARGRSILVLVMIALPVLGVTAATVLTETAEVTGVERADRVMGAADARVWTEGRGSLVQAADPDREGWSFLESPGEGGVTEGEIRAVLGDDARLVPIRESWALTRIGDRVVEAQVRAVDLGDPLAARLFTLDRGHLPEGPGEVVANQALLDRGFELGDRLEGVGDGPVIVGIGRDADVRDRPVVLGPASAFPNEGMGTTSRRGDWLVAAGPVSWSEVRELNALGAVVTSRAVLADPPDLSAMAEQLGYDTGGDEMFAVVTLIIVMALLEVVLLAGPAFAVGARRQSRTLALIAASGGTPGQARRVVLAGGIVLGAAATVLGLLLGVLAGWAMLPVVQRWNGQWFGPFEVRGSFLAAIAGFGLLSAFLAAVVPAWVASRQDVVAVLAGRRGDRSPRASTPVLGVVLLASGIGAASYGAVTSDSGDGAIWIASAAIVSVLGMVLVVPVVVAGVARLSRSLPLTVRYAARDAARHRTRTVPAVAAVAATVAGVVALGIAAESQETKDEHTYTPRLAMGTGSVSWWATVLPGEPMPDPEPVWARLTDAVRAAAPDADVLPVQGIKESDGTGISTSLWLELPGGDDQSLLHSYGGAIASPVLFDTSAESSGVTDEEVREEIDEALAAGRAVVFTGGPVDADEVALHVERWDPETEEAVVEPTHLVPATYIEMPDGSAPTQAILAPSVAAEIEVDVATVGLLLAGDLDPAAETRIEEAVRGVDQDTEVYVERGYQRSDEATVVLLVLGGLGGVLMLGGTLTATFLALSDARPDLATLSAVGAAPRMRRAVAASYALVVGFVGAALGAGVGFIPGVAISRPLTTMGYAGPWGEGAGPFLDIPWLLIGALVLALPLVTAAVVGLTARSRLPLVARLD